MVLPMVIGADSYRMQYTYSVPLVFTVGGGSVY